MAGYEVPLSECEQDYLKSWIHLSPSAGGVYVILR